ncbi:hypothetical protein LSH36_269g00026 [Paralvinella palmiformis]|uniref:Calpain-B n=1 Tax=Paralvinella palmiformis TaxID=53620 RepID=A0AAD9N462_9ANNE|nr:hypothetical protein LSH36_269g00026 [Paralvinella palmiformis]
MSDSEYKKIKERLLRNGQLFEDPEFPASAKSIKKSGDISKSIQWKRPKDIVPNPKFIIKGATRFDLYQGELGDCWFVAAVACLAVNGDKFLERIVPPDQTFEDGDYAGIFQFTFWQFDRWVDVIIDDRMPTINGKPCYAHNRGYEESNEFWVALLEKAYAKLYGCYDNINGGMINDALVDFTGGISESIDLKKDKVNLKTYLYELMFRTSKMASMMGCAIPGSMIGEHDLGNGLFSGHAYSITKVARVTVATNRFRLLRLRNPWGEAEWSGAWGDSSLEWRSVSEMEKKKLGLLPKKDGEFWMSFEDWIENFERLSICHLYPDALTKEVAKDMERHHWEVTKHHSEWVEGFSAGGCGKTPNAELFWTNPQFAVTLNKTDDVDADGRCTLVVSLMQKSEDLKNDLYISYKIYQLRSNKPVLLSGQNYDKDSLQLYTVPSYYMNTREVTSHNRLSPGTYVIIPATYYPNKEGSFFLRVYTEAPAESKPVDTPTVIEMPEDSRDKIYDLFMKHSGGERRVDATELQNFLSDFYKTDIQRGFGIEVCRSLVSMMDRDKSGLLDFEEIRKMITELNVWKSCFSSFDTNRSGNIDTFELGKLFEAIGFKLSRSVMSSIIRRYGGKKKRLLFEDFIHCCTKIVVLYGEFYRNAKGAPTKKVELDLEQVSIRSIIFCGGTTADRRVD